MGPREGAFGRYHSQNRFWYAKKKKILKARDKQFSSCGKSLGEFRRLIGKVGFVTS